MKDREEAVVEQLRLKGDLRRGDFEQLLGLSYHQVKDTISILRMQNRVFQYYKDGKAILTLDKKKNYDPSAQSPDMVKQKVMDMLKSGFEYKGTDIKKKASWRMSMQDFNTLLNEMIEAGQIICRRGKSGQNDVKLYSKYGRHPLDEIYAPMPPETLARASVVVFSDDYHTHAALTPKQGQSFGVASYGWHE